jgi:hypothetical protein|uniref:YolD-like protein n=1 Tax=Siphoviridae sp. ctJhT5 TaxID=2826242 RepID=A0A8S5R046_9CAUD|nr:MAG TPA: YolD-like protein [Siphoviridae sp. ctJhT5]
MGEAFMAYHTDPFVRNYDDRGMAKWMGFYLSEHTSEMEKDNTIRNTIYYRREKMSEIEISSILDTAYRYRYSVIIQLNALNTEGFAFEDVTGVVEGFNGNKLYLSDVETGIQIVSINSINHIALSTTEKWSQLS